MLDISILASVSRGMVCDDGGDWVPAAVTRGEGRVDERKEGRGGGVGLSLWPRLAAAPQSGQAPFGSPPSLFSPPPPLEFRTTAADHPPTLGSLGRGREISCSDPPILRALLLHDRRTVSAGLRRTQLAPRTQEADGPFLETHLGVIGAVDWASPLPSQLFDLEPQPSISSTLNSNPSSDRLRHVSP